MIQQSQQLPVSYITSDDALGACIAELATVPAFAFDLEFDRDHYSYGFDLCLMQIATTEHCYLIDPKAAIDITQIFPLLEDASIQKIVHCSGEDLRLLHSLQCYPKNLADTELYAKLLNYERTSLSAMLQQLFGMELDKKMQKINWTLRPMSQEQMDYAANDVRYLPALKNELEKLAIAKNILSFVEEENALLSTTIYDMAPKENFLKKSDLKYLTPYDQHILNGMFRFRDGFAQQYNKPPYQIINENILRSLAFDEINHSTWPAIKGVHPGLATSAGKKTIDDKLDLLHKEAAELELSKKRNGSQGSRGDFDGEKTKFEQVKSMVFVPVQNAIAAAYGENAMRFIFSTTLINSIIKQQIKIGDLKTNYRRELIRNTAKHLGIDISAYE